MFTIVIESKPRDGDGDDDVRLSRLTLIVSHRTFVHKCLYSLRQDLAGSEKAVSDLERRGEGKHINRRYVLAHSTPEQRLTNSLLALKNVINKLTDKKRSAPSPQEAERRS